jgi:hypothetical protein
MTTIELKITDDQAHTWGIALSDYIKRQTGKTVSENAPIENIVRATLLTVVMGEFAQQALEAESIINEDA